MQKKVIPWSDNWWIEDNKAWFCAGEIAALFCVDMVKLNCEFVRRIPECDFINFRTYSYCIKYGNEIFCLPNGGNSISCYNTESKQWKKIDINSEKTKLISIASYNPDYGILWMIEDVTGKIFEINLDKKVVEREYQIPCNGISEVGEYIVIEGKLYGVIGNIVYCIDHGSMDIYEILDVKADLFTICYDGYNFWLSGYCKEIYVWNPEQGIVKVISDLPEQFGLYHFEAEENHIVDCDSFISTVYAFFIDSILLGRYIWYIPYRSDEIVYIDKQTYEVHLLEVGEERETKESIENHILDHKYLVQYIRENRYIGIYSLRNGYVFEIDTVDLCVKKQDYVLSDNAVGMIDEVIDGVIAGATAETIMNKRNKNQRIFREKRESDLELLITMLLGIENKKAEKQFQNIGDAIYHALDE